MTDLCGIICEYNPFHNGHAHHIQKTRELVNCPIICVMSGDFVQRAQPALVDKRDRATLAIENGADAVIELPVVFSTAGGQQFASGAVEQLGNIKNLRYISFGIETNNPSILQEIAKIQLNESQAFKQELNHYLKSGKSYALSYSKATESQLIQQNYSQNEIEIALNGANNILAIEYLKAIERKNLKIQPIFINRCDKGYNNIDLIPPFASASAIRTLMEKNQDYSAFAPKSLPNIVSFTAYNAIIRNILLNLNLEITNQHPTNEQILDQKIINSAKTNLTIQAISQAVKSKAHTLSHINRRILQLCLNITQPLLNNTKFNSTLLAIKSSFKPFLKFLPDSVQIKAIKKVSQLSLNSPTQLTKNIDILASNLYAVITNQSSKRLYEKLIIL